MLFDTHAHLDADGFDTDRDALLGSLAEHAVTLVMDPACNLESAEQIMAMTKQYPFVYGAVGTHPSDADEVDEAVITRYREMCKENPKIKAIGEIGLDYHYDDVPRDIQRQAFRRQLELAGELELPVIVHDREAHEDTLAMVREFPDVKGVFHCYSGSAEMARQLVQMGWYIGFTGVLTFKNARKAVEVAASIPLERIVIETDSPYLAPEPFRGKRNDPRYVYRVAEKLAEIRGLTVAEICSITMENGKRLYRL